MMLKALKCFRDAGDYDAPIREWEARPPAAQTYPNLKIMMSLEYSKLNRQDATTARAMGHASANAVEEFAQATEELVAEQTEKHQGKQRSDDQEQRNNRKAYRSTSRD
jgi:hypothetical protein